MSGDRLFLLKPGFEDPDQPGRFFVCPHCNAIEGLLASFPGLATQIEVHRLPFLPRTALVEILGEQHQSLPVLVFDETQPVPEDAGVANGRPSSIPRSGYSAIWRTAMHSHMFTMRAWTAMTSNRRVPGRPRTRFAPGPSAAP